MGIMLTGVGCAFGGSQDELQLSIDIPDDGVGKKWMEPDRFIDYGELGILVPPTIFAPSQYDALGTFGKCVFLVGKVLEPDIYEGALVMNDGSASVAQNTGDTLAGLYEWVHSHAADCS